MKLRQFRKTVSVGAEVMLDSRRVGSNMLITIHWYDCADLQLQ